MTLEEEIKRLIEVFNQLADSSAKDAKNPGSDFRMGMDHGLSIGYRSAANHLQSVMESLKGE